MTNYSYLIFAATVPVLGFKPWDMTTDEMEACADLLHQLMPLNRIIADSNTEIGQALASGEVVMAVAENSLIWHLQEAAPGMDIECDSPNGTPNQARTGDPAWDRNATATLWAGSAEFRHLFRQRAFRTRRTTPKAPFVREWLPATG